MTHLMPQEIEVWYIIPAIRRELSIILVKKGHSQKEVSKIMGITEAAVSQYIRLKRANKIKFSKDNEHELEQSVLNILNGSSAITEIQRVCNVLRSNLTLCKIHRHYDSSLSNQCDLCIGEKSWQISK